MPWRCGDRPWAARTASRAAPHSPRAPRTPCPTRHGPHSSHAGMQQSRPAQRTEATVQPGIVDAGARGEGCPRRQPRRDLGGRGARCGRCGGPWGGPWGGLWAGAAAVGYAQSEQVACPARRSSSPAPGSEGRVHAQQCGAARGTPGREIGGGGAAARRAREGGVVEQPPSAAAPPEARVEHEPERHRPRRIPCAGCAAAAAAASASSTTSAANAAISASSAWGPSASF